MRYKLPLSVRFCLVTEQNSGSCKGLNKQYTSEQIKEDDLGQSWLDFKVDVKINAKAPRLGVRSLLKVKSKNAKSVEPDFLLIDIDTPKQLAELMLPVSK